MRICEKRQSPWNTAATMKPREARSTIASMCPGLKGLPPSPCEKRTSGRRAGPSGRGGSTAIPKPSAYSVAPMSFGGAPGSCMRGTRSPVPGRA